jgi:hypothetical protein
MPNHKEVKPGEAALTFRSVRIITREMTGKNWRCSKCGPVDPSIVNGVPRCSKCGHGRLEWDDVYVIDPDDDRPALRIVGPEAVADEFVREIDRAVGHSFGLHHAGFSGNLREVEVLNLCAAVDES